MITNYYSVLHCLVLSEFGLVHRLPDVYSESGSAEYGLGPGLLRADDPAAGNGAGRFSARPAHS